MGTTLPVSIARITYMSLSKIQLELQVLLTTAGAITLVEYCFYEIGEISQCVSASLLILCSVVSLVRMAVGNRKADGN